MFYHIAPPLNAFAHFQIDHLLDCGVTENMALKGFIGEVGLINRSPAADSLGMIALMTMVILLINGLNYNK